MDDNQILLITNRGVRPGRNGASLFKNKLTKDEHRLRCAVVTPGSTRKHYELALIEQGNEAEFLRTAVAESNDRPWLFYVHGNNQTLAKNLRSCFELEKLYDVNIVAFSWPSVHYGKLRSLAHLIPGPMKIRTSSCSSEL